MSGAGLVRLGKAFIESTKYLIREAPELDEVAKRITLMVEKRNAIANRPLGMEDLRNHLARRPQFETKAYPRTDMHSQVELNSPDAHDIYGLRDGIETLFKRYGIKPDITRLTEGLPESLVDFGVRIGKEQLRFDVDPKHLGAAKHVMDYVANSPIANPRLFVQGLDDAMQNAVGIKPQQVFTATSNTLQQTVSAVAPGLAARVWGNNTP
jgi:hypothetical protein